MRQWVVVSWGMSPDGIECRIVQFMLATVWLRSGRASCLIHRSFHSGYLLCTRYLLGALSVCHQGSDEEVQIDEEHE